MPLGLTSQEYGVLAVAIVPAVLAVIVVWVVWRWANRAHAEEEKAEQELHEWVYGDLEREEPKREGLGSDGGEGG